MKMKLLHINDGRTDTYLIVFGWYYGLEKDLETWTQEYKSGKAEWDCCCELTDYISEQLKDSGIQVVDLFAEDVLDVRG